jgi:hypothetical protein|nr:MAG TPA: protein of unknown function (DUF4373) [Caudoviricetes sp.]
MARPKKQGLLYFSFDTDFFYSDRRIKALRARFGNDGIVLYIWILCEAYKDKGYYLIYDDDCIDNMMTDLGLTEGFIKQIMEYLASRSLLTQISTLAGPVTTITSPGIQKRYQEAMKGQKRTVDVKGEIWLLSKEETASFIKVTQNEAISEKNHSISEKNHSISEKNPLKEKKVKERKVKENKVNKNTGAKEKIDLSYFSYDEKLNEAFLEYAKMREKIKKPISTQHTVDLLVKKLKELSTVNGHMDNDRAIAVLDQSIMNNWQDLYGLKSNSNSSRSFNNQGGVIDWDKV